MAMRLSVVNFKYDNTQGDVGIIGAVFRDQGLKDGKWVNLSDTEETVREYVVNDCADTSFAYGNKQYNLAYSIADHNWLKETFAELREWWLSGHKESEKFAYGISPKDKATRIWAVKGRYVAHKHGGQWSLRCQGYIRDDGNVVESYYANLISSNIATADVVFKKRNT